MQESFTWALSDHVDTWSRYCTDLKHRMLSNGGPGMPEFFRSNFLYIVRADIASYGGTVSNGVITFESQERLTEFVLKYS